MAKRGIILMNLGSPDSTSVKDLKKYLTEFLMDERVIDKPFWLRTLLVRGIIVPFRAAKSAEAYQKIWTKDGSPLVVITKNLQKALQVKMPENIEVAMRYGNPAPTTAYENLLQQNPDLEEVILVPLYPHYAMSSYETAVEYMKEIHAKNHYSFQLKTVPPFYNHPAYINALAENMRPHLQNDFDQLLFSYHGIPERHIYKTDKTNSKHDLLSTENCCENPEAQATCYRYQVMQTSKLVAEKLGLKKSQWQISYQSRLGRDPWLQPNTQERLPKMPNEGIKKLVVVCPSFVSDCLETLEEIDMRGREDFLASGGESYEYIPCMNTNELWVNALVELINEIQ
ncbi:ferrochelatase [Arachidicoccus ginsenosidimutans]|uniref:ferrochelatase n=1 Tax=Arachidicoccus sp. BS20 TaxID=1850526 RepID=UPI0007F0ECE0|nr:ferrochelatase [Arachidicoccus sp. BS20]ANI88012.1 ferrochelatase [Arachidicoccus sp. BS20]